MDRSSTGHKLQTTSSCTVFKGKRDDKNKTDRKNPQTPPRDFRERIYLRHRTSRKSVLGDNNITFGQLHNNLLFPHFCKILEN